MRPVHGKWARNAPKTPARGTPSRQAAHISSPNHGQRSFVQTFLNKLLKYLFLSAYLKNMTS